MGWRGFGFVYHSRTLFCRAAPNPNITIRNFFIAARWPRRRGRRRRWWRRRCAVRCSSRTRRWRCLRPQVGGSQVSTRGCGITGGRWAAMSRGWMAGAAFHPGVHHRRVYSPASVSALRCAGRLHPKRHWRCTFRPPPGLPHTREWRRAGDGVSAFVSSRSGGKRSELSTTTHERPWLCTGAHGHPSSSAASASDAHTHTRLVDALTRSLALQSHVAAAVAADAAAAVAEQQREVSAIKVDS
jgi:hypothetical protein